MPEVGSRPSQFNPIQRPRDNTSDLEAEEARVAARYRRKSVEALTFTDSTKAKSVPPMPSRVRTAGGSTGGNGPTEPGNGDNGNGDTG